MTITLPHLHLEPPPGTIVFRLGEAPYHTILPSVVEWCEDTLRGEVVLREISIPLPQASRNGEEQTINMLAPVLVFENVADLIVFKLRWA